MYFESAGRENTMQTIELAVKTAKERGIKNVVIASNTGDTALLLKDSGLNVAVVTHVNGFREAGIQEISDHRIEELKNCGFKVYTSTHVLSGAERAISKKFGGISPVEIMAYTLRMFGQGVKVAVEVATMALDGGVIPYGEDIISIGGSGKGADTAVILSPAHGADILDTKIKEIICKPYNF
ncbi:MAG: hypothetical protein KID00_15755 [Clostridium argentinense]|uniref:Pyruvate kinase C-terminal domain-containing protein n=1 Tax=Clostridium faecium TaxID=2762223 RepID=A0ABR8YMS9_9CLOT|nr:MULTISPECIES: pyruvate kinase alpha/beta domain-containing protein [Clostridium]MBD8045557.1 hypothetical protein [Clostridium faecium]MBS5825273.1 hypothetical protein [Clostridium argentinense]MDU1350332.1 pyruvate kinase alpha/beta domain-containing protein [Clostridium argentinense]